ncbi:hypothetical protein [Sphingobacterium gobiense]|nr:hypothetical protein [Sphingobacterium gobiense]
MFNRLSELDIKTVIEEEKERNSKDITPVHLIGIDEGIYPNKNRYILATPRTYENKDKSSFKLETQYFYGVNDSLVKVILYQWDLAYKNDVDFFEDETYTRMFNEFQSKFDDLAIKLTKEFGQPVLKNLEQNTIIGDTFRDDLKFQRIDGLHAYLFMFGNNSNGYRQIRLAIYKE